MNNSTKNLDGIAIVGMAGRFPRARNLEEFWRNLCEGREAISFFSDEELAFPSSQSGVRGQPHEASDASKNSNCVKARAILQDADMFDAAFFGMNPHEAGLTDPQHRVFLECAWEALENAGCDPQKFSGAIGVFAGMSTNTYLTHNLATSPQLLIGINGEFNAMVGNDRDFLPTRVSYKLNLKGPSLNIQTACSTSLVAVSVACQHLLTCQCDMALAGAVSISFPQKRGYLYQEGAITSPDGHCRPFDAASAGTVAGEGVGVVALKRLEDAIADGDSIYAVIKGFGMNNDGGAKIGYTAPSVEGQAEVIAMAQAMAGFDPRTISYVEAHGTATPLGDPVEIEGLTKAFRLGTDDKNFCAIGSVKGNIGHLDTAAGIAGLIKTALALHHKKLPPSLHFKSPNPKIAFADSPFFVNAELRDWKCEGPRRAGISSFGIGGTNAHVVLEEAPEIEPSCDLRPAQLLLLSARTDSALDQMTDNLAGHMAARASCQSESEHGVRATSPSECHGASENTPIPVEQTTLKRSEARAALADIAFTLQTGRHHFAQRRMLVCRDRDEAVSALKSRDPKQVITGAAKSENPPVIFMFPGQGAQRINMGRELYEREAVFRGEVDCCAELLKPHLGFDIRNALFPGSAGVSPSCCEVTDIRRRGASAPSDLSQTSLTQPAMFVIEYALAKLWMSWGVRPQMMIGHSLGEYVAACLAGVFALPDALKLIAARGRMIQQLPTGAMLAVRLPENEVRPLLSGDISLAAVNAPALCVVSGPDHAIEAFKQNLAAKNIACIPLLTSHAFHSAMMEPILFQFTELVQSIPRHAPRIPFISNLTGKQITVDEAADPAYWASHLRRTVRFADGLNEVLNSSDRVLLEAGPGRTLAGLAKQIAAGKRSIPIIASLPHPGEAKELDDVLSALGQMWVNGISPDWKNFHAREKRRRVWLPTYPFERKRYWIEPPAGGTALHLNRWPEARQHVGEESVSLADKTGKVSSSVAVCPPAVDVARRTEIETETIQRLRALIAKMSGFAEDAIDIGETFTRMGFDSLFLTQASVAVEREFGVRVGFRQLLEQFATVELLAAHIESRGATERGIHAASTSERNRTRESLPNVVGQGTVKRAEASAPIVTGDQRNGANAPVTAPLTESQRELWFASQMSHAASCVYNECRLMHLGGVLKSDALRAALRKLVDRHDALRTTFSAAGDAQIVHPSLKPDVLFSDWSALTSEQHNVRLHAVQLEEARNGFDLTSGPLIRVRLIRLRETHHVFLLTIHHIICDGHSFDILLAELGELYSAEIRGASIELPAPLQLGEYAKIQSCADYAAMRDADEAFWLKQFEAEAPVLELPTDQPRPAFLKFDGARVWRVLPPEIGEELKRIGAQNGCTLFTTLLAAYVLLLRRLARQNELVVGIPMADRMMPGGETLIGHCVNFLPLRGCVSDGNTFLEHLAGMQKLFLEAHDHRRYAFGTLIQKLNLPRDPSRMPLVSATFNLERRMEELNFAGLKTELTGNAHSSTSFDLNFDVADNAGGLLLDCRYSSEVFSGETIERWLGHFETLLKGIIANPRQKVFELPLLNAGERAEILDEWSLAPAEYPRDKCIHELFEEQAAKTPDAVALEFGDTRLSYRELNERAERIAEWLLERGARTILSADTSEGALVSESGASAFTPLLRTGMSARRNGNEFIIAVCLERSPEMMAALLGILKAGGAYMSLEPAHPRERQEFMLRDTCTPVLLTQRSFRDRFAFQIPELSVACIEDLLVESGGNRQSPIANRQSTSLAYVSFTSGSSGRPKGVCITHRAVVRLVKNSNYVSFRPDEIFLQYAPLAFDASTFEIWGALLNGARLVIAPPRAMSLAELGAFILERKITTLWLTAGLFHQMIEEQVDKLRGVRQLLAGGDVLSVPHVKKALEQLPDCRLINGYGPTENTTFTCCHQITRASAERRSIPIGRPIANTEVYVLDEHLQPVPIGVPGELHCGGDGLALGYLNRDELNAEKFIRNPFSKDPNARLYRTGDLVRWLPDGEIEFLGRLDTQVKIRGFRVELDEIEAALNQHPAIRECAVVADEHPVGKRLLAYFVATASLSAEELRGHLRKTLPDYMIPSAFARLESMPLRTSGKVNRKALLALEGKDIKPAKTFVAASDDLEKRLAGIWEEVLEQKAVGASDDFFELGGHSMLALRLVARIERAFGKRIPIASVFYARTVAQMADLLRDKTEPARTVCIVPIQERGARPPLMFVHGAGGGMFWGYTKLSRHLGNEQPVFAFKSRGMDDLEEFQTIEEMAAHYVMELKRFQPRGPYHLGGYCFGGNVAYEMARQLRAGGDDVALLALINSVPPNSSYDHARMSPRFCVKFLKNLVYWTKYFLNLGPEPQREFLRWKLGALKKKLLRQIGTHSGLARFNFDIAEIVDLSAQPESRRSLWETHVHALFAHRPKSYDGDVTLFRTRGHSLLCSFDETFGWCDLVKGELTVRVVSGAHETILDEPHVRSLAAEFEGLLEKVQSPRSKVQSRDGEPARAAILAACCTPETRRQDAGAPRFMVEDSADRDNGNTGLVHELFEQQVQRTPDAVAVVSNGAQLTYRELNDRADALAEMLRSLGARTDVPVGICFERSLDMVVGVLGILKSGGAYVPLDPAYPRERLKLMIENSQMPLLLTQNSLREHVNFEIASLKTICIDGTDSENGRTFEINAPINRQSAFGNRHSSLAYVIHTSGSTGVPKGVAMPHGPLVNLIRWQLANSSLGAGARTLQFASLSFDVSFQEMFSTWCGGGTLVLIDEKLRRDPVALLRFIAGQKVERLFLPFIALQQLAEAFGEHTPLPSGLREVITAGEQLQITPKIVRLFEALNSCALENQYGPSETHVVTAFKLGGPPNEWPALPPIGKPVWNTQIHLLDDKLQPVPQGEIGELYIAGDCLARSYLHRPDLTEQKFVPNPFSHDPNARLYKTGDLARLLQDGNIEFLGRADEQVKIRGFRIELGEIETALRRHTNLREAVVVAREDQPGNKRLVAYFIPRAEQGVAAEELREFLKAQLPEYMVPSVFLRIELLPLTPSGKVDRKRLPAPELTEQARKDLVVPATPIEEQLAAIWHEVLGLKNVGTRDNFFDLGGHSLLAVQVTSRMRQVFGLEVPVGDVFALPTIAELAEGIAADRWKPGGVAATIPKASRDTAMPLSFAQERLWFLEQFNAASARLPTPAMSPDQGENSTKTFAHCDPEPGSAAVPAASFRITPAGRQRAQVHGEPRPPKSEAHWGHEPAREEREAPASRGATRIDWVQAKLELCAPLVHGVPRPPVEDSHWDHEPLESRRVPKPGVETRRRDGGGPREVHAEGDGAAVDNVAAAVLLKGRLDCGALERSFNEIVRRHEILRTIFVESDGEPAQQVLPELKVPLTQLDLSAEAELLCLRPNELQRRIAAEARKPFDLERGPLVRCSLLKLDANEHVFVVVMHHIVSDGWSLGVVFDELSKLIGKVERGGNSLPELPIQFADYAAWQREHLKGDAIAGHLDYWRKTLAGAPPKLKLPDDRHAAAPSASGANSNDCVESWRGARQSITLPKDLLEALRDLNRRENATPFITLLAGLFIALNRWTKESDIVIGTVHAGRTRRETENLIGCFLNILPIRGKIFDDDAVLNVLKRTRSAVLESLGHVECPFEKVVEAIKPDRNASRTPVFNVGFLLQNFPKTVLSTPELQGEYLPVENDTALLDLRFVADEDHDGITLSCEYREKLFETSTIERLLASYRQALEVLANLEETKIGAMVSAQRASLPMAAVRSLVEANCRDGAASEAIAVAATFTAEPLEEPLRFWMSELELPADVVFAPYNQVFQQLLDPASLLGSNVRGLNVLLVRMEDWARELSANAHANDETFRAKIEEGAHELILSLLTAAGRSAAQFLVCICPSVKATRQNSSLAEFFVDVERMITGGLTDAANVRLVSSTELAALYPVPEAYDPQGDELGHVPYTPTFFTALATMIARKYHLLKHPAPKVIVLDCDQTLWSGICGEDGPEKIEIDPPRRALQEFMRAQLDAGRLLCLCSKNNEDDVHAVFKARTEMPLRREHFVASRINWQPKSENVRDLARELNLGLDSFVLVDDNPVECADIEANCAGTVAVQLPDKPELIPQFLKHCWIFDAQKITAEDRQRTAMYRQNQRREQLRSTSRSLSDFLESLDLKVDIAPLAPEQVSRAAQLTQRTNQFNLTTRRRTEAEIKELLQDKKIETLAVSVSDRFGDYGLVGFVIGKVTAAAIEMETFLLSCRVLGRGVEHRILSHIGEIARQCGLAHVDVPFVPSAKNKPGFDFLESIGAQFRQPLDSGYVYRFPADIAAEIKLAADNRETTSLALASGPSVENEASLAGTFARWRWIALEANDAEKIQELVETKIGVRAKSGALGAEPRTETERQLSQIWSRLLRVERVGAQDNFFELGGHSLLAVRLFTQIHKHLGIKLPVVTIFQSPTVEQLARTIELAVATQSHDSVLLPIQPNGGRPPLFLVHGAGGDVLWGYANLACHIEREQPIYGIQACGREKFATLEDMAAYYVEKVREFQPEGPYHLGGYCFGGNVAYEMARQLEKPGQRVALLALLDAAPSNAGYEKARWWRPRFAFDFARNLVFTFDDFCRLKRDDRRNLVRRKLRSLSRKLWRRIRARRDDGVDLEEVIDPTNVSERELRLWKHHLDLLVKDVSKPYGGHVTLFRTRAHPLLCSFAEDFSWGELSPHVTVKQVPGSHEGVFVEPHVRQLAEKLNESLRACLQQSNKNQPVIHV